MCFSRWRTQPVRENRNEESRTPTCMESTNRRDGQHAGRKRVSMLGACWAQVGGCGCSRADACAPFRRRARGGSRLARGRSRASSRAPPTSTAKKPELLSVLVDSCVRQRLVPATPELGAEFSAHVVLVVFESLRHGLTRHGTRETISLYISPDRSRDPHSPAPS